MLLKEFDRDQAHVMIFQNRNEMGRFAGGEVAEKIRELQKEKKELNIMFAAAPSQKEVLEQLTVEKGIDWGAINAFHMDEYIGISRDQEAGFANFLKRAIFSRLPFKEVFYLDGTALEPEQEAERYAGILNGHPLDICVLGVGENGHIAFNDPGAADLNDPLLVKVVNLDETCRRQQVNDGCFTTIGQVPSRAITVTVTGLLAADYMFCVVPGAAKADAVNGMLNGEVSALCPASALTRKPSMKLYLDVDSACKVI